MSYLHAKECAVGGDSGAPVTVDEVKMINKSLKIIKKYMSKDGIDEASKRSFVIDSEGDLTTTLVNNKQCAFVYSEKSN